MRHPLAVLLSRSGSIIAQSLIDKFLGGVKLRSMLEVFDY